MNAVQRCYDSLLIFALFGCSTPALSAVYGDRDDRVPATPVAATNPGPNLGPATAIGRLQVGLRSAHASSLNCTAFLIAPDLILTNAHCISPIDVRVGRYELTRQQLIQFYPMYHNGPHPMSGTPLNGTQWSARVTRIEVAPQDWDINSNYNRWVDHYNALPRPDAQSADFEMPEAEALRRSEARLLDALNDWVVLRINQPLGLYLGYLPFTRDTARSTIRHATRLNLAGYSSDFGRTRSEALSVHHGCTFLGQSPAGMVSHDCDSGPGASGGPIYQLHALPGGGYSAEVFALNVGDVYNCSAASFTEGCDRISQIQNRAIPASQILPEASGAIDASIRRHTIH